LNQGVLERSAGGPGPVARVTSCLEQWISSVPVCVSVYTRMYRGVVDKEIALAGITRRDRVLNVGCGAAPFTGLLVARKTGARVLCVERDDEVAAHAERSVAGQSLGGAVEVLVGDAMAGVPEFDVAVVALQATPKLEVLRTLAKCSGPEARLVVRDSAKWCQDMYDRLPPGLTPRASVYHHMGALHSSVLYYSSDIRRFCEEGVGLG